MGKVGRHLVPLLLAEGARPVVADVDEQAVARVLGEHDGVRAVGSTQELLAGELDVYSPCALGHALTEEVARTLRAGLVCGGANNQLATPEMAGRLADRGILYAPDYLVNAGGVIQVEDERHGFSFARAQAKASGIFDVALRVFQTADKEGVPPSVAADRLAEERMASVGRLSTIRLPRA